MIVDSTELKKYSGEQDRKHFCSHRAYDLKTLAKKIYSAPMKFVGSIKEY